MKRWRVERLRAALRAEFNEHAAAINKLTARCAKLKSKVKALQSIPLGFRKDK